MDTAGPSHWRPLSCRHIFSTGWMDVRGDTLKRSGNNRVSPASPPGVQGAVQSQTLIISLIVIRTF